MRKAISLEFRIEPDGPVQTVTGRDAWAMEQLNRAGSKGVTPIDNPGPRWSAYVHNLRQLGLVIETIHERHEGDFPGTHARYVLSTRITIMEPDIGAPHEA